jgi:hypothetical protein
MSNSRKLESKTGKNPEEEIDNISHLANLAIELLAIRKSLHQQLDSTKKIVAILANELDDVEHKLKMLPILVTLAKHWDKEKKCFVNLYGDIPWEEQLKPYVQGNRPGRTYRAFILFLAKQSGESIPPKYRNEQMGILKENDYYFDLIRYVIIALNLNE